MKCCFTNLLYLCFLIVVRFPANIYSQDGIISDRPGQSDGSSIVPKLSLQIESGMLLQFYEETNYFEKQIGFPTNLFRYGLTENFELRFANQYQITRDQISGSEITGISDLELGFKFRFINDTNINTELAILSHLLIPSGSKELTNGKYGSINNIAISHELSDRMSLGYNLGYNYFGYGDGDLTYSISIGNVINEKAGLYIEYYGEYSEFKHNIYSFDAGITYRISKVFQVDFSSGTGINNTMNFISCGFAWNIR